MSNESYLQIYSRLALAGVKPNDIIVVWSRENGALAGIEFSDFQIGDTSSFQWTQERANNGDYDTGSVVVNQAIWYISLIDDNAAVPVDDGVNWQQVNKINGIIIPYWAQGLVQDHLTLFREGTTIYGLRDTVTLPFLSNITPSLDPTNWEIVGGGGGGSQLNIDAGTSSRVFPTITQIDGGTSSDL